MVIFVVIAKHLSGRQLSFLGFSWLIVAGCLVIFTSAKEAKLAPGVVLNNVKNAAQVVGFIGAAFGSYYANLHPHVFMGYGIFLASWLVLAYFLYTKLRKKGYRLLRRRIRPDNSDGK